MKSTFIKCSEKLPQLGVEVLVYDASYRDKIRIATRYGDAQFEYESNDEQYHWIGNYVDGSCYLDSNEVTGWQKLPKIPKGKTYQYKK